MDFSSGGFGDAFIGAGSSFLSSITGTLGSALGQKLNQSLGLGAQGAPAPPPPATAPAPTPAAAPQAIVTPAQAAGGWSSGTMIAAAVGGTILIVGVVVLLVKVVK